MRLATALLAGLGLLLGRSAVGSAQLPPGEEPPLGARGLPVVAGAEGGRGPDFRFGISWRREDRTAALERELQSGLGGGRTLLVKDLVARQTRQVLDVHAAVGLWRDLSLFLNLPIVLADDRWLDFDRRAGSCDSLTGEGAAGASADCVNETSSSLLRDGVLPGAGMARYGLDARTGQPFQRPSSRVFRGPTRRGIEYLGVGFSWALMNQRRDDTRPTWIVALEPRFALGSEQSFDPLAPEADRSVNPGYHQLVLSTLFSRRFSRFQPFLGGFYALPRAKDGGSFDRVRLGDEAFAGPQHRAGADTGFEYVGYEAARAGHKVTFELRGTMELRFFGLARSDLWEPLSGPGTCRASSATCRPELDRDLDGDGRPEPYSGLTRTGSYGVFGGGVGVNAQIAGWLRLRARGGISFEQDRFLSDGRSGITLFDVPGRRFRVDDARTWTLATEAQLTF